MLNAKKGQLCLAKWIVKFDVINAKHCNDLL